MVVSIEWKGDDMPGKAMEYLARLLDKHGEGALALAKAYTPPRIRTSRMLGGWTVKRIERGNGVVTCAVGNPWEHAIYNEFGTRYMAAHPMLEPAARAAWRKFIDEAKGGLAGALR